MRQKKQSYYSDQQWNSWFDELARQDLVYIDNFLPAQLYKQEQHYFQQLLDDSEFSKAAIGSSEKRKVESSIRGDFIYWLDKQQDNEISPLFDLFDEVVAKLRQHLFLSLSDYEFHFALYPPQTR